MARRHLTTSFVRMALRGLVGACPRCGGRGWFSRRLVRRERCSTCGYRHERQAGFMLGAMAINVIVTFFLLAVLLVVGSVATYPDIAAVPMVIAGLAVALVWPVVFYPASYTLWAAVDLVMRPLESAERVDADRHANPAWLAAQIAPNDA